MRGSGAGTGTQKRGLVGVLESEGEERLALYAKNVFYDEKHEVAGLIGTFIDITERRDAEARLKQSLIQTINALSSAMAHRDMSTASHEKRVSDLAVAIGIEVQPIAAEPPAPIGFGQQS